MPVLYKLAYKITFFNKYLTFNSTRYLTKFSQYHP